MKLSKKICGICMEELGYGCAEFDRMEGRNVECQRCWTVKEIIRDGIPPHRDTDAHKHMIGYYSFWIRVYSGSNMKNLTLDRRD